MGARFARMQKELGEGRLGHETHDIIIMITTTTIISIDSFTEFQTFKFNFQHRFIH